MAFAGMKGERMILFAEIYGNHTVTSCPFRANDPKAENLLKTKGQKRRFSFAKAENILKIRQLLKPEGTQNLGDKLFSEVDHMLPKPRFCLILCVV